MKTTIPAIGCLAVLLYCWLAVYRSNNSFFPPGAKYNVQVTVTDSDGRVIEPVEPQP